MRFTTKQMFPIIETYQSGNIPPKIFCRQQNIKYSTFQYWQNKYNKSNHAKVAQKTPSKKAEFIPVKLKKKASNTKIDRGVLEIFTPSGIEIKISFC